MKLDVHGVLDIDGTVGNFVGGFREYSRSQGVILPDGDPTTYSMIEDGWLESKSQFKELYFGMISAGGLETMELLDHNTTEVLNQLSDEGFDFSVGTARFHDVLTSEDLHSMSYDWFVRQVHPTLVSPDDFFIAADKSVIDGQFWVEDADYQWEALVKTGRRVYLRDQSYNRHCDTDLRFSTLEHLAELLVKDRDAGLIYTQEVPTV